MELWIHSQDKMKLVLVKNIVISVMSDSTWIEYKDYDGTFKLGEYKTKERALEVLDEIQKKINLINIGHDFGSPMIDLKNPTYIYEMPKE